jgi:hypothetical protein
MSGRIIDRVATPEDRAALAAADDNHDGPASATVPRTAP